MNNLLGIIFLSLVFSSCISTKWHKTNSGALNLDNDLQHLNSVYYNAPLTIEEKNNPNDYYPLYALLFERDKIYEWNEFRDYSGKIKIDVISNKKIKVSYLIDDLIVEEKMITGKLTGNIFSSKRRIRFLFLMVFNYYNEVKTSIFLNEDNELVVIKQRYAFGSILFASGGGDDGTSGHYARAIEE